jgi:hypothetical protein
VRIPLRGKNMNSKKNNNEEDNQPLFDDETGYISSDEDE